MGGQKIKPPNVRRSFGLFLAWTAHFILCGGGGNGSGLKGG